MNTIREHLNKIRDYINNPRKHYELRKKKELYNQLCSSLDVIGDTEEAILAFEAKEFGNSVSVYYLVVYGLLQAVYVQQDAVNNLYDSLGIPRMMDEYPILLTIREIRNDAVGHPTKRNRKPVSHHHISRSSLGPNGFDLLSFYSDGTSDYRYINLTELIVEQRKYIFERLHGLTALLEAEEIKHRDLYRRNKLAKLLPEIMSYYFEKIFDGIATPSNRGNGADCVQLISDHYHKLIEILKERGEYPANDVLVYNFNEILYPIEKLKSFYLDSVDNYLSDKDAYIFARFLRNKHSEILRLLEEIDREYEKTP